MAGEQQAGGYLNSRSFRRRDHVCLTGLAAALCVFIGTAASAADNYPSRPIHVIVPTQPGSSMDVITRLMQPYLE